MFPKVICEVGFQSDPTTPISNTTWTDISPYLLDADWDKGGRQYELDRAEAGTMTVRLYNSDRRFEPEYASSPYYPNVVPLRRIRMRIGENPVTNPSLETDLTGWTVGATFTIARSTVWSLMGGASLKTTFVSGSASSDMGAIPVTVAGAGRYAFSTYVNVPSAWNGGTISVNAENYAGSSEVTALRHDANLSLRDQPQRIYRVYDIAGGDLTGDLRLRCASFPTGTPFIYSDGFQVATLDGNGELQPYVDQVRSVFTGFVESWPPAYQQRTSFVTISCVDGFEPLAQADLIGGDNLNTNPDFEIGVQDYTVTGGGTLARDTTRFAAGVASGKLTAHAATGPTEARTSIAMEVGKFYAANARIYIPSGLGITASNVTIALGATGSTEVTGTAQNLTDQFQLVPLSGLFSGVDVPTTFGRTTTGTSLTVMQGDTASNGDPVGNNKQVSSSTTTDYILATGMFMDITGNPGAGPSMLVKGVIYADSSGVPGVLLAETEEREITRDPSLRRFEYFAFSEPVLLAPGTLWRGYLGGETSQALKIGSVAAGGARAYNTDVYADGASPSFGTATTDTVDLAVYVAGSISLSHISYGYVRLNETGASKNIGIDEFVIREVPEADGSLYDPAGTDLDAALSGMRVSRVLNAVDWPVADRVIDTGTSVISQADLPSSESSKALSHIQDVSDAEFGVSFCDGDGKFRFQGRARRFNPVPVITFTDSTVGAGIFPYREAGLVPSYDKTRIANDVRITPDQDTTQIASDSASRAKYMQRTVSKSLPLDNVDQAADLAQGILNRSKDPHLRFERLTISPVAHEALSPGFLNAVLAREVSDCATVRFNPPGAAGQVSKNVHLEKASFTLQKPAFLDIDYQLSPVDPASYWVVEDPVYGAPDANGVAF